MYNRYIPQSDGTFQRSRIEDNIPAQNQKITIPPQPISPAQEYCAEKREQHIPPHQAPPKRPPCMHKINKQNVSVQRNNSISSFLKQLLPKDFDTSDLMIVLLLLIMSGDCAEDQNTALLTLVLYLFL